MTEQGTTRGIALMLGGCLFLTVNDAIMKGLVTDLPLGQVVCLRATAGVMGIWLLMGRRALMPNSWTNAAVLSGLLVLGLFLFPWSLRHIPLADGIMLVSLSPLVVAALSPWMLGERVGWRRWSAVALGIAGAWLVLDPLGGVHVAMLAPIVVAFTVALRDILTRRHIEGESAIALVAVANMGAMGAGVLTVPEWVWLSPWQWAQIAAAGALLTVSLSMITAAFRYADAAVMSCLKYSAIVWAAALGWLFWEDRLTLNDWIGAALITAAGVIVTLRTTTRTR